MSRERKFPLLGNGHRVGSIPWWVAEQAYIVYASKYGDSQSLERLAERGGFGIEEMDGFFPEWREKASVIDQLKARLTLAEEENQSFGNVLAVIHRDGGHYITKHGHEKASVDAIKVVLDERTKLAAAEEKIERMRGEVEFWMGEGDGAEWPPENMEWRKLFDISKSSRTPEQIKRMGELATIIRWKGDEKIQYERADAAEEMLEEISLMGNSLSCKKAEQFLKSITL